MASYLKASIQRSYAESFLTELERNENQYFFFIAKSTAWTNDNSPPVYTDSIRAEYDVMNNIIGYKKLNPENVIFALPRYEWTANTVYDSYDDNINLFDDNDPAIFYVVTDENNIYKCINNGGSTNASTIKPTLTISTPFSQNDGYTWQYLATVKEGNLPYELTDYVPIEFATVSTDTETQNQYNVQVQAVPSSITRMVVTNSSGAALGKYPYTVVGSPNTNAVLRVAQVNTVPNDPRSKVVVITDATSKSKLVDSSLYSNYVGYAMRVDGSTTVDRSQINNYGIITAVQAVGNAVQFTVTSDTIDFALTTSSVSGVTSVEILPYIKIAGNGTGAYAFPTMNTDNSISSITMGNGGRDYSNVSVQVLSAKTAGTDHPTIRAIIAPKGGHGSNILKELNVKDVLIIVEISDADAENILGGGSYRQFGIVKNPLLADGSGIIAGSGDLYYRDISIISENSVDTSIFDGGAANVIIGTESYSSAKVIAVRSGSGSSLVTLKTQNSAGKFVTKQDRVDDYIISLGSQSSTDFQSPEKVTQTVPAGTVFGSGVSFGYSFTVTGNVLDVSGSTLTVRLTSDANFITGISLSGAVSGATGTVSAVSPRNGEYVWVSKTTTTGQAAIADNGAGVQKQYKIYEVGSPYFDLSAAPSYSGLHALQLSTSVGSLVGAMDSTSAALTQNSFSSGDTVYQGSTASYTQYASGKVYYWDFVNSAYGTLYLTDVVGSFKSVAVDGITGSTLGAFIVADVTLPEIDRTSGEVLYIDNVRPIQRNMGQKEEFRLRLGF
jgi:hypothetical protein